MTAWCCRHAERAGRLDLPLNQHSHDCQRLIAEMEAGLREGFEGSPNGALDQREAAIWEDALDALHAWASATLARIGTGAVVADDERRLANGVKELLSAASQEAMLRILGELGPAIEAWVGKTRERAATMPLMGPEKRLYEAMLRFQNAADAREHKRPVPMQ